MLSFLPRKNVEAATGMTDSEVSQVRNWTLAGLLGGSAYGAAAIMRKHLQTLARQAEQESLQNRRSEFQEELRKSSGLLTSGIGLSGGVLAAVMANQGIQSSYDFWRRKELQKQLENAEQAYVEATLKEAELTKQSSSENPLITSGSRPTTNQMLKAVLTGLVPITFYGSTVLTRSILDKAFGPDLTKAKRQMSLAELPAVREKLREEKAADQVDDFYGKSAKVNQREDRDIGLYGIASALPEARQFRDLLGAVSAGRIGELEKLASEAPDSDLLFCVTKGAGANWGAISKQRREVAKLRLVKSAYLRPAATLLACAEIADHAPTLVIGSGGRSDAMVGELEAIMAKCASLQRSITFGVYDPRPASEDVAISEIAFVEGLDHILGWRSA